MPTSKPLVLAVLLITAAHAAAAESALELWETWYSVSARVRTKAIDADLEAGGRLAMAGLAGPSGQLTLRLRDVLEPPWKLYWVDPLGPAGKEVKVASVVTLREASWDALEAAQAESAAAAAVRHRRWLATAQRPRELDGSFAFVVIGDARNGFGIEIGSGGSVATVTNRMTDRWLPGPFDQFVDPSAHEFRGISQSEAEPAGYWFWNHGEGEPHSYEPHTYHAFAAALSLLSLALPPASGPPASGEDSLVWQQVAQRVTRVLSILAPRMNTDRLRQEPPAQTRLTSTRERLPAGGIRLTLASPASSAPAANTPRPHIDRETVFSSEGRPVSDRIRVRITSNGETSLEVEAGYRPWNAQQEAQ